MIESLAIALVIGQIGAQSEEPVDFQLRAHQGRYIFARDGYDIRYDTEPGRLPPGMLVGLLPPRNSIRGMGDYMPERATQGPHTSVRTWRVEDANIPARIQRWFYRTGTETGDDRPRSVLIAIDVREDREGAVAYMQRERAAAHMGPLWLVGAAMASGEPLAEEHWLGNSSPMLAARQGRVVFEISPSISWRVDPVFMEALARCVQYRILQHEDLSLEREARGSMRLGGAEIEVTRLNGVPMARLSELERIGVASTYERGEGEVRALVRHGARSALITNWSNRTSDGASLELPVFPYGGELVVPVRSVAGLLGIRD
jgi:hypothetical protein